MMLPSHGPEPCASANSATSAYCGRWDLNPHEHTPTRSLVLPVCQFQHSRLLLFIFACRVSHSLTKLSIAQALRECKHFFVFFIFFNRLIDSLSHRHRLILIRFLPDISPYLKSGRNVSAILFLGQHLHS